MINVVKMSISFVGIARSPVFPLRGYFANIMLPFPTQPFSTL